MSQSDKNGDNAAALPRLRTDLEIKHRGKEQDGSNTYTIFDPVQRKHFHINETSHKMLTMWNMCSSIDALVDLLARAHQFERDPVKIEKMLSFLRVSGLLQEDKAGNWVELLHRKRSQEHAGRLAAPTTLLFRKFTLGNPERALHRLKPLIGFLFSPLVLFAGLVVCLLGAGHILTDFSGLLRDLWRNESAPDLILVLAALVFSKLVHEAGHAFVATRYGVRVSRWGVAFVFCMPMLFTDVSDAWRLDRKNQRMAISAAGILSEILLAGVASLLWATLPPGELREVIAVVAATSWVSSLFFNLNPLMKFDGYFLLCDWTGFDNLQPRSFAYTGWFIRKALIAPGEVPPEQFSGRVTTLLLHYGFAAMLYRVLICIGIATMSVAFLFWPLAVAAMLFAVWALIVRPVYRELRSWTKLDATVREPRRLVMVSGLATLLLAAAFVPISNSVSSSALAKEERLFPLFAERSARIQEIHAKAGGYVTAGSPILTLENPQLDQDIEQARLTRDKSSLKLRRASSASSGLDDVQLLIQEKIAAQNRLDGLIKEQKSLTITAPFSGQIADLNNKIHIGQWVDDKTQLGLLSADGAMVISTYMAPQMIARLTPGAKAVFVPDGLDRSSISATLKSVGDFGARRIELEGLAAQYGGSVAASAEDEGKLSPLTTQHLVVFQPNSETERTATQQLRGRIVVEARSRSVADLIGNVIAQIISRYRPV